MEHGGDASEGQGLRMLEREFLRGVPAAAEAGREPRVEAACLKIRPDTNLFQDAPLGEGRRTLHS